MTKEELMLKHWNKIEEANTTSIGFGVESNLHANISVEYAISVIKQLQQTILGNPERAILEEKINELKKDI